MLGFASGLRHALEPDHLAAVSTLIAGERSTKASVSYAAAWGAGHAIMLLVAGGAIALLRTELSLPVSDSLELVVAAVLIALGVRGLKQAAHADGEDEAVAHSHRGTAPSCARVHVGGWTLVRLPFVVGLVHGLAGSGALAALVAAHVSSTAFALAFIVIYGLGAAAGMAALAGALGWPLSRMARARRLVPMLSCVSGCASLTVGVVWALPIVLRLAFPQV